ncbi:Myosin-1 [Labeo rohita]|uniref:Myosin-1 n=1 Tax=Labeo rohita TaxID=84645 RepID=A0ABQ8LVV8_LABRO|nr:Myosin-1 [Labeo rohita]
MPIYADLSPLLPPSSKHTETAMPELSPEWSPLPELSPEKAYKCPSANTSSFAVVWQPLHSPSALHLCGGLATGLPVSIGITAGGYLVSTSRTPPSPVDPAAPPWLLAPSSPPWPGSTLALPSSLFPPAPAWSVVDHPAPRDSTPLALPQPSVPLAQSGSSIPPAPPLVLCCAGTLALRILLVILAYRLSISALGSSATCFTVVVPAVSGLPWSFLLSLWLLPPLSAPRTLFVVLLLDVHPPPEPPPKFPPMPSSVVVHGMTMRLPEKGDMPGL